MTKSAAEQMQTDYGSSTALQVTSARLADGMFIWVEI